MSYSVEKDIDLKKDGENIFKRLEVVPGDILFLYAHRASMGELGTFRKYERLSVSKNFHILMVPYVEIHHSPTASIGGKEFPVTRVVNRLPKIIEREMEWIDGYGVSLAIKGKSVKDISDALRNPETGKGLQAYLAFIESGI